MQRKEEQKTANFCRKSWCCYEWTTIIISCDKTMETVHCTCTLYNKIGEEKQYKERNKKYKLRPFSKKIVLTLPYFYTCINVLFIGFNFSVKRILSYYLLNMPSSGIGSISCFCSVNPLFQQCSAIPWYSDCSTGVSLFRQCSAVTPVFLVP